MHQADNAFDGLPLDVLDDERINSLSTKEEAERWLKYQENILNHKPWVESERDYRAEDSGMNVGDIIKGEQNER